MHHGELPLPGHEVRVRSGRGPSGWGSAPTTVAKQKQFSDKHEFDYPLLSDPDGAVATQFGVRRRFTKLSPTKRATFVIGTDLTILDVITSEVRMNVHADRALEVLKSTAAS